MSSAAVALFVAGGAPRSAAALRNLTAAIAATGRPEGTFRIELIDVLRDPARALEAGLLATPSLALTAANGRRRWFIGDFDRPELLAGWLADVLDGDPP
ncbi:circadian clock KaiB family protein [Belnapia sp. F-4-1]|uniref:circadian clock KaiB family protein n=1 Tax=Belnapia sp. F-4-1 TaxID=1545443 RepID=UPI0005BD3569|nr:circadian clock KaiB family protein [Belnapia sp. F-4-1]